MFKHSVLVRTSLNMTVGFLHISLTCLPAATKVQGSEGAKVLMCMHLLPLKVKQFSAVTRTLKNKYTINLSKIELMQFLQTACLMNSLNSFWM